MLTCTAFRLTTLLLLAMVPSFILAKEDDFDFEMSLEEEEEAPDMGHGARNLRFRRNYRRKLKVTNLSVGQPFSAFFVMEHDSSVQLYEFGDAASPALARLAEDGDPQPLVDLFDGANGVQSARIHNTGAPYFGGNTTEIEVTINYRYRFVTIAAMAINTNDMFVALNGVRLDRYGVLYSDGLDAGSEENNELCQSVPGPVCRDIDTRNRMSGNGEGFVHVHPGVHGIGNFSAAPYDWRNPVMRVDVW